MKKIYLLDASGYIYRSYHAIQNMTNARGESTNALFGFVRSLLKLMKDFQPKNLVAVFDGPQNVKSREAIFADYKAHRPGMPPDLLDQIYLSHQFCELYGIPQLSVPGVEADDTIASIAVWAETVQMEVLICSSDKDLCQLVDHRVKILQTHKDNAVLGPKEVEENFGVPPKLIGDLLALTGDSSDNVPGIPGVGPKTAAALLKEFGSLEALLKHPEKIENKKRQELIVQGTESARLSRKLVEVDTRVPIPHDPQFYQIREPDIVPLKNFYTDMSFHSLIRELETLPTQQVEGAPPKQAEEVHYHLVDDEPAFAKLLYFLSKQKEICIDAEGTHLQPMKAELVGIAFAVAPKEAWYVPVNGKLGLKRVIAGVKPLFENEKLEFYGHNFKFDEHVLRHYGIQIKNVVFDTILASYILKSHSRQHSLDGLALELFGKIKTPVAELTGKGKKEISMWDVPLEKVSAFSCESVDYTCRLKNVLEPQLKERKLLHLLLDLELPLTRVLGEMERTGIYLEIPLIKALGKDIDSKIKETTSSIYAMAGEEFNISSPKQLGQILFEKLGIKPPRKTATGFSTDADVLDLLQKHYPIAGKILEYRMLDKLRSTYVDALPAEVDPKTHRIHCTFNQSVAATGRLASQSPNLQNIPVRTELGRRIREAFRPEKEGWVFLAADYSQIELRLLAHLSKDPLLLKAFKHGEDIHAWTASQILNIPLEQVTKQERQGAKAVNFGVVYGQQAFGLSQELGIEMKQAAEFIEMYFKRFPKVKEYIEHSKEAARKTGRSVTLTGRERLIPEIHSKNIQLRSAAERLAINTPLQGTAADLIKLAMLKIAQELKIGKMEAKMILQIHDELIFESPESESEKLSNLVKSAMESVYELDVPLIVDINIGKNWKEC